MGKLIGVSAAIFVAILALAVGWWAFIAWLVTIVDGPVFGKDLTFGVAFALTALAHAVLGVLGRVVRG